MGRVGSWRSGPEPVHGVGCELTVAGDQREVLDPRLSYEHTIERVAMVEREGSSTCSNVSGRKAKPEASTVAPNGAASRSLPKEV